MLSATDAASTVRVIHMYRQVFRYFIAAVAFLICLFGIRTAWQMGLASTYSEYVLVASQLPAEYQGYLMAAADEAVRLSPSNPDAHFARGIALESAAQLGEAGKEFERAVMLRPTDYKLWLKLGSVREE